MVNELENGSFSSECFSFPPSLSFQQHSLLTLSRMFRRRRLVGIYRRFGTTCGPHLQGYSSHCYTLEDGFPETSVINYKYNQCDITNERKSHTPAEAWYWFVHLLVNFHIVYKTWYLIAAFKTESNVSVSRTRLNRSTPTHTHLPKFFNPLKKQNSRKDIGVSLGFFFSSVTSPLCWI